jgi:hypothetical protein
MIKWWTPGNLRFWRHGDPRFWSLLLWITLLTVLAAVFAFPVAYIGG